MEIIKDYLKKLRKPKRLPASQANIIALSGAVLIDTGDGHNIVVTPDLAREIGKSVTKMANSAEGDTKPHGTQ